MRSGAGGAVWWKPLEAGRSGRSACGRTLKPNQRLLCEPHPSTVSAVHVPETRTQSHSAMGGHVQFRSIGGITHRVTGCLYAILSMVSGPELVL